MLIYDKPQFHTSEEYLVGFLVILNSLPKTLKYIVSLCGCLYLRDHCVLWNDNWKKLQKDKKKTFDEIHKYYVLEYLLEKISKNFKQLKKFPIGLLRIIKTE